MKGGGEAMGVNTVRQEHAQVRRDEVGGKTWECWPLKGQRRGSSDKMFILFSKA